MSDNEKRAPRPKDPPPPPPEKPRKRKRRRHVGLLIVLLLLLIIAILILMLVYGGFGGGSGSGSGGSGEAGAETSAVISDIRETPTLDTDTAGELGAAILIEINGEKIIADGEELENAAALKEKLLSINKEGSTYIIRDSHAVKSVYDEAKAVLDELAYSYSEDS